MEWIVLVYLGVFLGGLVFGVLSLWVYNKVRLKHFQGLATIILNNAETKAQSLEKETQLRLQQQQIAQQKEIDQLWQTERKKINREEERLKAREDRLESHLITLDKKSHELEKKEASLLQQRNNLDSEKQIVQAKQQALTAALENTAGMSASEAKTSLLQQLSQEVKVDAASLISRTQKEAEEEAEKHATRIVATTIQRVASRSNSEGTVNTVTIPSEEMKGRIIGREGRNIRAFEQATGVSCLIDETPNAVVLSCFDPIRLHVAKWSLQQLVSDGRIYPTRIEEVVESSQENMKKQIKRLGEDAALRAGAVDIHPELITLLGKLKFRYSLGQNVLDHSLEVSHLLGIMAAELSLDIRLAKRIGLLHDIGKAVSHEVEGSHAIVGHDIALKHGERKEVANGIGCHHNEMPPLTVEGSLCSAADAISASRPGARIEAVDEYIKRLQRLEEIALEFPEVGKAYAMQAGRELRIMILPEVIDDISLVPLARNITKRIEEQLSYPGKIKVTLIREKRVVEYAL